MKRISLSIGQKILLLNLSVIIFMSALFAVLSHWHSHSMYSRALNGIDTDVLERLAPDLEAHYAKHGNWQLFIDDANQWGALVNQHFFTVFFEKMADARSRMSDSEREYTQNMTPSRPANNGDWQMPFGTFLQRVMLLDNAKNRLIKPERETQKQQFKKLTHNGEVVGWLSVGMINLDMIPLASYFYQQQIKLIAYGVGITAALAILLSMIFSWRLVQPIKRLVAITQATSQRQYHGRLDIQTGDEIQQLAESINHLNRELASFEQRQKQWLMDISHELRTPLSILLIETSAICDKIATCDINAVAALRQDVLQIQRLVNDLHSLSELDSDGFSLQLNTVDLAALITEQARHFAPQLHARGIVIHNTLVDAPPLQGDGERLIQVMQNILSNCQKYTEDNGEIWIAGAMEKNHWVVTIEDSGPGVDTAIIEQLTDRLFRADISRNSGSGGRGLGLAIASAIMKAHGGQLKCVMGARGGLSIQCYFPMSQAI